MSEFKRPCDFVYQGNSMKRLFRSGDGIYIEKRAFEDLKVGDVVCFDNGSHMVVHRLIGLDGKTQGDNNCEADLKLLTPENFAGVAIAFRSRSGIRRVRGGAQGWRDFKINQFRMRFRRGISRLLAPLRRYMSKLGHIFGKIRCDEYGRYQLLIWHGVTLASRSGKDGKINFRPGVLWFFDREKLVKYFEK